MNYYEKNRTYLPRAERVLDLWRQSSSAFASEDMPVFGGFFLRHC